MLVSVVLRNLELKSVSPMEANPTVLLVEDDENDVAFFRRALAKANVALQVHVASDGQQAIDYMSGAGGFADRDRFPFPKLIITDTKMTPVSGAEFLQWLKNQQDFHVIPTIVLGGSATPAEVETAYEKLGVHSYIIKPSDSRRLQEIVKLIFDYWAICVVPSPKRDAGNP
jgi:CheY-like chemotaxis protein